MRKTSLLWFILLAVVLTGCMSVQETATPTTRPAPTTILDIPSASEGFSINSGCTVVAQRPTPGPTPASPFLPIGQNEWSRGPEDARVTIIEYSDFQ
jgi:FtsH-binding integral membrane protein